MTLLDSLGFNHDLCCQQVCAYLKEEAVNRLKIDLQDFRAPVYIKGRAPRQHNGIDCGVHCLYCIKGLYQDPDHVWPALISPGPSNDSNWVPNLVTRFRQELSSIFKNKTKEYDVYKKGRGIRR
jgi:Ulp1 family protease